MAETPSASTPPPVARRDEDIALDLMKFIAGTTGYGKTGGSAGFQGVTDAKTDEYAKHLLSLYTQCLTTIRGK